MAVNRNHVIIGTSISMCILAILAVCLRIKARKIMRAGLAADDWTILLALLFGTALSITSLVGAYAGVDGKHTFDAEGNILTTAGQRLISAKGIWVRSWLSVLGPGFTKISVILFYKRIFMVSHSASRNIFNYACWSLLGLSTSWTIAFFFTTLLQCVPIHNNWAPTGISTFVGCVDFAQSWMALTISDVLLDALILTLPWHPLSKLQMSLSKKLTVASFFLLGAITVLAAIFKTVAIHQATSAEGYDYSYSFAPSYYWAVTEVHVGVIGACLPCLGPIFASKPIRSAAHRTRSLFSRTSRSNHRSIESSSRSMPGKKATDRAKFSSGGRSEDEVDDKSSSSSQDVEEKRPTDILRTTTITMNHIPMGKHHSTADLYFGASPV